jgi:hypothetical protein
VIEYLLDGDDRIEIVGAERLALCELGRKWLVWFVGGGRGSEEKDEMSWKQMF